MRDLGLLVDLYFDAMTLAGSVTPSRPTPWAAAAGENTQALARATVQACFNLLESFVSGLGRAHVMMHPELEQSTVNELLSTQGPLSLRVRKIPATIVGADCPLQPGTYPFVPLFDGVKQRRDAFVHCQPGPMQSKHGYVKEAAFHDTSHELVLSAVRSTHDAIRALWEFVHGRPGPRWLPDLEESGRFGKPNLRLVPREAEHAAQPAVAAGGAVAS